MESIEVEAQTVEEAIKKAIKILKTTRENIEITILSEGKKGLFGMPGAVLSKIKASKKH